MADVYPYVDGQVYTDGGRYTGDWQADVMSPITSAAEYAANGIYGFVDGGGRVAVLYPSAARTATPTAQAVQARGATGLAVFISATAAAATPSVVATIDGYDPASATWYNILTAAAITGVATKRMIVHPTVAAAANLAVAQTIPETIRVVMTHGDADSLTYSVSLDWMP